MSNTKVILYLFTYFSFITTPAFANSIFVGKPEQKPLSVAIDFLYTQLPSGDSEGKEVVTLQQSRIFCKGQQLCPLQAKIIFTIDGLNDDSVQKEQHILILQQNTNQSWEVIQDSITRACKKGRGHRYFSQIVCQ